MPQIQPAHGSLRKRLSLLPNPFARIILFVLNSVGMGAMPDAADYGDEGRDTLGHIAELRGLNLSNMVGLGLANIRPLADIGATITENFGLSPPKGSSFLKDGFACET